MVADISLVPARYDRERHLPLLLDADEVEIWNIALSEGNRGRGLGRAAIGAIADRCRRDGASRLTVGTSDCSLGTIAFYRKVGFRFAGVRQATSTRTPWPWSRTASAR